MKKNQQKKGGNAAPKQQQKQKQPQKPQRAQMMQRRAKYTLPLQLSSLGTSKRSNAAVGGSGLDLWRRSLLDPFNTPGAQMTGDFFVRGAIPYTIKRNIQLTMPAGSTESSVCVFPSLNTMAWCPDGKIVLGTKYTYTQDGVAAPNSVATAQLISSYGNIGYSDGITCPQLNNLFSKYRIVSMGVRVKCDASLIATGGKMTCVTVPYSGYLPVTTTNATSPGVFTDNPYTTAAALSYNDRPGMVYESHPNSVLIQRSKTPINILNSMGVGASGTAAPTLDVAKLAGMPLAEVVTINEITGRVFEVQPRPCDASIWKWRSTGRGGSAFSVGAVGEGVQLDEGSDAFPGAMTIVSQGAAATGTAGFYQVDVGVDASPLMAGGYESTILTFSGIPSTTPFADLELVYNVEVIPSTVQAGSVAGCQPSVRSPEGGRPNTSRASAENMLFEVSSVKDKIVRDASDALGGLMGAAGGAMMGPVAGSVASIAGRYLSGRALAAAGPRFGYV